ncbi:uncharacterized protein LOC125716555 isoform X2 [Brienomyrus brachyistius]|uniref:uncharacterized protein LOC125716555 isoform X2 n=1 Tax=Brienomyrus brachyistius TaxID=42636 RepID=UPI0020B282ED|nr:uncharacterized protein LOC125716555 isoform X2 [Brienomyrus brachyistius]
MTEKKCLHAICGSLPLPLHVDALHSAYQRGKTHHAERQRVKSLVFTAAMELGHKTAVGLMTVLACVEAAVGWCTVSQPQESWATTGDSLTLNCTFQVPDKSRVRVTWSHSNGSQADRVQVSSTFRDNRINVSDDGDPKELVYEEVGHSWSKLTLMNTNFNNQGIYFCEVTVEIPTLDNCSGNGTNVIIGKRQKTSSPATEETSSPATEGWEIWLGVGVGIAFLLTGMMLGLSIYCWKKRPKDVTYANIPRARRPFSRAQPRSQVPDRKRNQVTCLNRYQDKPCQAPSPKSLEALTKLGGRKPVQTSGLKT